MHLEMCALEWLGGVPREGVYDNLRSVVARREGDEVVWNPRFLHLRGHYGFHASPCTPASPREKGSSMALRRRCRSRSGLARARSGPRGGRDLVASRHIDSNPNRYEEDVDGWEDRDSQERREVPLRRAE